MEVTIKKTLFLTVDIDVPDDCTKEELASAIKEEIENHPDVEDWDEFDWRGKEVYEAYETYGGTDIELNF